MCRVGTRFLLVWNRKRRILYSFESSNSIFGKLKEEIDKQTEVSQGSSGFFVAPNLHLHRFSFIFFERR